MSETPFMPLWVGDFIAKTQDLDAKETGAYMLLLMSMWTRDGSLPHDMKKLQRVARVGRDWAKVWDAIKGYFEVKDGKIYNKRLSEERDRVNMKRRVNAQSGARGGRAKALKDKERALANAANSLQQSESESEVIKREAKASPKKGTRLSENWCLPRDWGEWALGEGWPETVIRDQADRFRDYWISAPGQKGVKRDWKATWRNWMRNSTAPKILNGGQHGQFADDPRNDPTLRAIAAAAAAF